MEFGARIANPRERWNPEYLKTKFTIEYGSKIF